MGIRPDTIRVVVQEIPRDSLGRRRGHPRGLRSGRDPGRAEQWVSLETQRERVPNPDGGEREIALAFLDFARHSVLKKPGRPRRGADCAAGWWSPIPPCSAWCGT
ncbi:hypothetical protein [Nocardioides convexus]|uniref:hypothetical protein n=1 Tax=Nocardioides convexus TaxID=2712224 RepID=UPI0024185AAE|nr:hypothetical protein [Nocardioides convexus]